MKRYLRRKRMKIALCVLIPCALVVSAVLLANHLVKKQHSELVLGKLDRAIQGYLLPESEYVYSELYFNDGEVARVIISYGGSILVGTRSGGGEVWLSGNQQQESVSIARKALARLFEEDVTYTCRRNRGPWKLKVMPESPWVMEAWRSGARLDSVTYISSQNGEELGWTIYNENGDVYLYFYLHQSPENRLIPTQIFGWGEVDVPKS